MLASISPLGERARSSRWGVSVTAYVLGSVLGGAAVGVVAAALGALLPSSWRGSAPVGLLVAALLLGGLLLDEPAGGMHLPTCRRQVDEAWLGRSRGWVCGARFGVRLALGPAPIVPSAPAYATVLLCARPGSPPVGLALGPLF